MLIYLNEQINFTIFSSDSEQIRVRLRSITDRNFWSDERKARNSWENSAYEFSRKHTLELWNILGFIKVADEVNPSRGDQLERSSAKKMFGKENFPKIKWRT